MTALDRYMCSTLHRKITFSGLLFVLICLGSPVSAQMASENFVVTNQAFVGCGGTVGSSLYQMTSTLTPTGGGMMAVDNWAVYGGVISVASGRGGRLLAFYSTKVEDTLSLSDRLLKVSFGGGAGLISGRMNYRLGGSPYFRDTTLLKSFGDTLVINFPSDLQNIRGLEFYFTIFRGTDSLLLGSPDSPFVWIARFSNAEGQSPPTRAMSYRMVSLPMVVEGSNQVMSVFPDDLGEADPTNWRLGSYENRGDSILEFPVASPVTHDRSYWLITRESTTYGAAGHSVRPSIEHQGVRYHPIGVRPGWSQIANPFGFHIDWRKMLYEKDGEIYVDSNPRVFEYVGASYWTPEVLKPWKGYFFHTLESNLRLLFPYLEYIGPDQSASPRQNPLTVDDFDWALQLRLHVEDMTSENLFVARRIGALAQLDQFDRPLPPPPPGHPRLGSRIAEGDPYLWAIDVRPPIDSLRIWEIEFSDGINRYLTIDGINSLPDGLRAILKLDIGSVFEIISDTIIVLPDDSHSAEVLIGKAENTDHEIKEGLPTDYTLDQNFPNPFNPKTSIRFALPQPGQARIVIYNLLGQEIMTLINDFLPAGIHTATWDGRGQNGRMAASGIYFYRLTCDQYQCSKKMLLIK